MSDNTEGAKIVHYAGLYWLWWGTRDYQGRLSLEHPFDDGRGAGADDRYCRIMEGDEEREQRRAISMIDGSQLNRRPTQRESGPVAIASSQANACLIAAAPDLLTALKDIVAVIEEDELMPPSLSYFRAAKEAIAKAEGSEA